MSNVPRERKLAVWRRDKWACRYCGCAVVKAVDHRSHHDRVATVDHIVPLAKGGTSAKSNLVTACRRCNNDKGDQIGWTPEVGVSPAVALRRGFR